MTCSSSHNMFLLLAFPYFAHGLRMASSHSHARELRGYKSTGAEMLNATERFHQVMGARLAGLQGTAESKGLPSKTLFPGEDWQDFGSPPALTGDCTKNPKQFLFIRHGLSVNNLMSAGTAWKAGGLKRLGRTVEYFGERLALHGAPRDSLLSHEGKIKAKKTGKALFGKKFDEDWLGIFDTYDSVYMSPLRRTQDTAYQMLLDKIVSLRRSRKKIVPMKFLPWAHEQRKSQSDVGETVKVLRKFANKMVSKKNSDLAHEISESFSDRKWPMSDDWAKNYTSIPSDVSQLELSYYPNPDEMKNNKKNYPHQKCPRNRFFRGHFW
eukprot:gnl/TRDRNA2_/TRDRNA2_174883_c0_seq15.p1 gnl/TRDRNA2_/TRDRNA2_174883_c0~~gnl/TRDRNA2_/TRDRNA2_174883_c0_seq15.p1  ORF type:complete len:324 (-),score=26.66 gnl/TRDRNA2_/TRDRNA2_174883_c0_seq15:770-1741(-)